MSSPRLLLSVLVVLSLWSCSFDTRLPGVVTCQTQSDCPGSSVCRLPIGQCVPAGERLTPPALSAVMVSPRYARAGTTVTLTFTVDAELQSVPEVLAVLPQGTTVPFTTSNGPADHDFVFTTTLGADAPEGTVVIGVRASDLYDNERFEPQTGATFVIDTTPPHASIATVGYAPLPEVFSVLPTALNRQGELLVSFTPSEVTSNAPTLRAESAAIDFTPRAAAEGTVSFRGTLRAGVTGSGAVTLTTHLVDLAGNEADVTLETTAAVAFDVDPPTLTPGAALTHVRNPTGSKSTDGGVRFEVHGPPGTTQPGAQVRAFAENGVTQLGVTFADDAGAFVVPLSPPDRTMVSVDVVDEAGNHSPQVPVRAVEFTAVPTLDTSATGTTSVMLQRRDRLTSLLSELRASDGVTVQLESGGSWNQRTVARMINSTTPALAWDPVNARSVSWGTGAIYGFDGTELQAMTGTSLPILPTPAMTFDRTRGVLVAFGGAGNAELWESSTGRSWSSVQAPHGPAGREGHVLVFDGQQVQLLGGRDPLNPDAGPSDFFRWNGADWSRVDAGAMPRTLVAASWDSWNNRVIALASDHGEAPETWVFTEAHGWQRLLSPSSGTPPEAQGPMVFDTFAHRVRFVANQSDGGAQLWAFDDAGWALQGPTVQMPGQAVSAFDEAHGLWVINSAPDGGAARNNAFYVLTDAGWQQPVLRQGPPGSRNDHAAIWDSERQSMIAVSGVSIFGFLQTDTVTWLGPQWVTLDAGAPPATYAHSFTATPVGRYLFGGVGNESGLWQLNSQYRWVQLGDGGIPGRAWHAAVARPEGLLVFGGTTTDSSMWLFDGGSWAPLAVDAGALLPRQGMSVVTEPVTNTLMSFGGANTAALLPTMSPGVLVDGSLNDNALFIGGPFAWRPVATTLAPRRQHTAVVDVDRNDVLLFGGIDRLGHAMNELERLHFAADGTAQSEPLPLADPEGDGEPAARWGHTAVFDPLRHVMQVYAGMDQFSLGGNVRNFDLWEYRRWGQRP